MAKTKVDKAKEAADFEKIINNGTRQMFPISFWWGEAPIKTLAG